MNKDQSNIKAQSLWNMKAVGSQRSESIKGTRRYFDDIRKYRYGYETPFIPTVFEFAKMKDKKVLEIGVGNGIDAVEMISSGCKYSGIDITENHIELTKKNIELYFEDIKDREKDYVLKQGDILDIDINDKFDYIYSFGVMHHIWHEEEIYNKLMTLLNEEGKLMVAVYSKYSFFNMYLIFTWLLKNRMKSSYTDWASHLAEGSELGSPVTIKIRSKSEIKKIIENSGYKIIKYYKKGFVQRYIPIIGRYYKPNGLMLNFLASIMGWYHCFICVKK
jgi:2-polyprenyl-3-methyl-5-hydroxy-6-metoxy-1,4-benzoquinol methylase